MSKLVLIYVNKNYLQLGCGVLKIMRDVKRTQPAVLYT